MAYTEPGTEAYLFLAQVASPTPMSPTVAVTTPVDTRREVQRYLIVHGYLHGQADGNLGPRTSAAIARYERHERLNSWAPLSDRLAYMRKHYLCQSLSAPVAKSFCKRPETGGFY